MEEMANRNDLYEQAMERNLRDFDKNSMNTEGDLNISRDDLHD